MPITCTKCQNSGFLNLEQINEIKKDNFYTEAMDMDQILRWIKDNEDHDVQVCDCCGNGEFWYGIPGEHYNDDDPEGFNGPYSYNGGLCECH